jgi:RNA polymerase sigma-70 factor (ECF subfamily)
MVQAAVDATEADLLAGAQGGNLFAFDEIVRRYQRRVYSTALRIVRRHDLADDVTQEAFLRAHRALGSYDRARPFGPWICRIAANLAINHVRSPEAREETLDEGAIDRSPAAAADGPLDAVLQDEARRVLEEAVGRLPAEQRAVFVLRTFEDLSYKEIAEALDLSVGTVMSRLSRAREKLRGALAGYLGPALDRAGGASR